MHILDRDILGPTFPTTTTIGRRTQLEPHPALEVQAVLAQVLTRLVEVDILHVNILEVVRVVLVLPDRAECDTGAAVAGDVAGGDHG